VAADAAEARGGDQGEAAALSRRGRLVHAREQPARLPTDWAWLLAPGLFVLIALRIALAQPPSGLGPGPELYWTLFAVAGVSVAA